MRAAAAAVLLTLGFAGAAAAMDYVLRTEPPLVSASVFVDDQFVGRADQNGKIALQGVAPGLHRVRVDFGGESYSQVFDFDAELNDLPVFQVETPGPSKALYRVASNTAGAELWIDGAASGIRTSDEGRLTFEAEAGRQYVIELRKGSMRSGPLALTAHVPGGALELQVSGSVARQRPDLVLLALILLLGASLAALVAVIRLRRHDGSPAAVEVARNREVTSTFDRYRIVDTIGAGGIGMIYRGIDLVDKNEVALKILDARWLSDPDMVRKFLSEGEALGEIARRAPGAAVVRCLRHGREHATLTGRPFVALELLRGETLDSKLQREGRLTELVAAGIAVQIATALNGVHSAGIVHRDLTPDNVFLGTDQVRFSEGGAPVPLVTLIDFGIARIELATQVTMDGSIAGKPQFMSPEQCRGVRVDFRSDLYSLGIIMFMMIAGRPPFTGRDPFEVMRAHQRDSIPDIQPACDPSYLEIVHHLLEKDAAARPSSAAAVASRLMELLQLKLAVTDGANLVRFPQRRKTS